MKDLRSFASTLCQLLNIKKPELATNEVFEELIQASKTKIKKALIYCPDAFGLHALKYYPTFHSQLQEISTNEVELNAVFPSVTPVCFASLFTGATPAQHGIETYKKPILKCDTLFDALLRAEKKVAIVAVKNSSVDMIFRDRKLDYFSMDYDPLVTVKALQLLEANQHDVIVVYHQEYDDLLHDTGPFSEIASWALGRHVQTYQLLVQRAKLVWKQDYLVVFAPDHGAHVDIKTGLGDHGLDIPEDMNLRHFYVIN
ncbi:MAG: alkaline phosphatase family protein [Pseudobdellovibrio sp.]